MLTLIRPVLVLIFASISATAAHAQNTENSTPALAAPAEIEDRSIIALVVSVGKGAPQDVSVDTLFRANTLQVHLQELGAQILRAIDPSDAELRSALKRLVSAGATTDVALVYLDMPIVDFEGRSYVLPADVTLNRATDVFTRAIPLSAFARAAATAGDGGAVFASVGAPLQRNLPGIERAKTAPEPILGASPVVLSPQNKAERMVAVFSGLGNEPTVELGSLLRQIVVDDAISISELPQRKIFLRRPVEAEPEPELIVPEDAESDAAATIEELVILEQRLSRSDKRAVQQGLRGQGLYNGFIDGLFGPQTRAAIVAFQTRVGAQTTGFLTAAQMNQLK